MNNKYHGIILDIEFEDSTYPNKFKIFAKRRSSSNPWMLYGVEIKENELEKTISSIQKNMKVDKPYYAHLYNDLELIVIFKQKVFKVTPHKSSWDSILKYAIELGIPDEQMDIWPNRFQDEIHYFAPADFL